MKPLKEVVATFSDLDKAKAVKDRLEQSGIAARVKDQSRFQKYALLSKPLACARVLVSEEDYQKARQILQTADPVEHLLQGEVRCLQCGSPHIDYPQFARKFIMTTCFGVVFSALGLIDKTFYCQDCHFTWQVKDRLRPQTDILNWPTHRGVVKEERG